PISDRAPARPTGPRRRLDAGRQFRSQIEVAPEPPGVPPRADARPAPRHRPRVRRARSDAGWRVDPQNPPRPQASKPRDDLAPQAALAVVGPRPQAAGVVGDLAREKLRQR